MKIKTDEEYYEGSEISPQRELAIEILDEFEELLEGYDLAIPDEDREIIDKRTGEESSIYGSNYWNLEDKITMMIEGFLKEK